MKVIITHEQADFDALASQLGASILIDDAVPVLPNRVNRNVRNFLNLYGEELSFIEPRDLPARPIKLVTLVDTQSMVTLKGITSKILVQVIDHHAQREDPTPGWEYRIEKVGATTTILVDLLRETNPPLSMIYATLMLLGIYEDTGSLTYASTTVRDINAAAYLLEKGASLRIAVDFLNPALSEKQKALADLLLENMKTHMIHGKAVVISTAEAPEMNEEISSIAHKLRDLLDPDALFLLVHTMEGIRLVARSTSDTVNVARVAHHFGGGGHERAAAALILPRDGEEVAVTLSSLSGQIIEELIKHILPPLTVDRIMSKRPHLISPDTSLDEVLKLMHRYGYEGFPVVEEERVVGLLTRRAVDRAVSHKLNLKAGSLMEAGNHAISSTESIDNLLKLMTSTGWGQVPVLDPGSGKIIGIVTRTDLLKTLPGHTPTLQGQSNYSGKLKDVLPPPRLALLKMIGDFSSHEAQALYIVGGFVRDLILNRPSIDFDVVVEGDAVAFGRALAKKFGGRVVSHRQFGTAKWQIREIRSSLHELLGFKQADPVNLPDSLDLISARTEFYDRPTALPTVERSSIKLDLHRRDFTINTLALRLDGNHYGELYDYWGGMADLEKKLVRVLHSLSFVDDPTRLLRAVRFEQRFGFKIEERTLQLMLEARELLDQVSGERLRHEFELILKEQEPPKIFQRLDELGLLAQVHPELTWTDSHSRALTQVFDFTHKSDWKIPAQIGNTPTSLALGFLVLISGMDPGGAENVGNRLKLPRQVLNDILLVLKFRSRLESLAGKTPGQITPELETLPIFGVYALYCLETNEIRKTMLEKFATTWRFIKPGVDGYTLKKLGIPPGPRYAEILSRIRTSWLEGIISTAQEEEDFLEELLEH